MIKKSILIIDDDIILLKTAEEILSDLYSVSVAKGGKQGIALLKKGIIPNLILLDIAMPEMDGYMTLEKIKGIPECEEVPVIFLTGFSESDYEVKGLKAGATDYIVKPFAKEVLLARVEMHLARSVQNSQKTVIDTQIQENRKRIQEKLTQVEWKVALAVAQGMENKEIAEQMNDLPESMKGHVKGGGSLTALPIIETQAGDVSAYIPTNVISITDGQIYLESDLFNQGFRPAINVGISVSRVGGSAQIKSMKKVAGTLKIDMAQYRELEAFSQFSSDMDAVTAMTLDRGRKNNQLLIQPQYTPMSVGEQVAILYCGVHGLLHDVPVDKVRDCQDQFLESMRSAHADVIANLAAGKLVEEDTKVISKVMANIAGQFKN